jgi:hypothetical protein
MKSLEDPQSEAVGKVVFGEMVLHHEGTHEMVGLNNPECSKKRDKKQQRRDSASLSGRFLENRRRISSEFKRGAQTSAKLNCGKMVSKAAVAGIRRPR